MTFRFKLLITVLAVSAASKAGEWNGFETTEFTLPSGAQGRLVMPKTAAPGSPWILVSDLYGDIPATIAMRGLLATMTAKGWFVLSVPLGNTFGAPMALQKWDEAYAYATTALHLPKRAALIGLSREGLAIHRWAAFHPDQVVAIYGDRAVCDFKSWPGGKVGIGKGSPKDWDSLIHLYGFHDEAEALAYKQNPIDLASQLASAKIPILEVVGEKDDVVSPADNALILQRRMKSAGGTLELILVPDSGHHPHGLADSKPIVDFLTRSSEDSFVNNEFQQWKFSLPPAQAAWERVLEAHLGSFYLPIYKREKIQRKKTAWDYVQDTPGLPRLLIIGDSVSRGYTLPVLQDLSGKMNVHRAPENCGGSANGLKNLDVYLAGEHWDVIHFNFGLHDRAVSPNDYEHNLRQMVERLKRTGSVLIWASITPLPPGKFRQVRPSAVGSAEPNRSHGHAGKRNRD